MSKKLNYPFKTGSILSSTDMNIVGDMMKELRYIDANGYVTGKELRLTEPVQHITDSVNADLDLSVLLSNLKFPVLSYEVAVGTDEDGNTIYDQRYLDFRDNEVLKGFTLRVPFNYCTAEPNVIYRSCGTLKEDVEKNMIQLPFPLGTIFNALPQNVANVSGQLTTFNMRMFGQDITIPAIYKANDKTFEGYSHRICFNGGLVGWGLLSGMGLPLHFSLYCSEDPTTTIGKQIRTKLSIGISGLDILLDGMPVEMIMKLIYGFAFAFSLPDKFESEEAYKKYVQDKEAEWADMLNSAIEEASNYGIYSDGIDITIASVHTSENMHSFMISLLGLSTDVDDNSVNLELIPGMKDLKVYKKDENGELVLDESATAEKVNMQVICPFGPITWLPGEIVENNEQNKSEYPYAIYFDYDIPYNFYLGPDDAMKTTIRMNIYLKDKTQYSNGIVKASYEGFDINDKPLGKYELTLHGILLDSQRAYQDVDDDISKTFNIRMLSLLGPISLITNIPFAWDDHSIENMNSSIADITISDGIGHYESTRFTGFTELLELLGGFLGNIMP